VKFCRAEQFTSKKSRPQLVAKFTYPGRVFVLSLGPVEFAEPIDDRY